MKVILLKDVKGQGKKDSIIDVSDGYGNNFLIKNKLAVKYTEGSKKVLDHQIKIREDEEERLVNSYIEIKNKLNDKILKFLVKSGKDGKVFGSVSTKQIHEELLKLGYNIDKKCIILDHNIDTLGIHKVKISLHKKVNFNINVSLIS